MSKEYFSYIMVTSFSGGRSRSTQRESPPMGKQLVNFITCGCESSAPFFVIYKAVLVIGLYELSHPDPYLKNETSTNLINKIQYLSDGNMDSLQVNI
jgi:hypothetical protein